MATYLAASDVFVGKAGPASVYEAVVVGRPALVTGYAGLNEVGVARLVEERGLGRYVRTPEELLQEVRRYALDPAPRRGSPTMPRARPRGRHPARSLRRPLCRAWRRRRLEDPARAGPGW